MKLQNLFTSLNNKPFVIPLLLLALAFAFKSPGLPPWGVASSNDQLLIFPPWQANYPDVQSRSWGGDPLLQQLPWHHWAQDEFKAGRFPLWASGPLGGAPLFASYQSAVLYPLNLIWMIMPIQVGAGIIEAIKVWLVGLGMWFFLCAMGLRRSAAFMSAVGLMFFSNFVVWLPWPHTNVFLLVPWLCWSVYAWCVQEKKGALVAFPILVLFAILGGHPENLSFTLITVGLWAICLIAGSARRMWLRQIAGLSFAGALGVAMGAIQLLPFVEAYNLSDIATEQYRGAAWQMHMDIGMSIGWILPRWFGQFSDGVLDTSSFTETNSYIGFAALIGLILVVVAAFRKQINFRLALPWLAIGLFAWILLYDDTIGPQIRRIPPLDRSIGVRWIFIVGFAVLVLSAFGWDWFARWVSEIKSQKSEVRNRVLGMVGLALLVLGIFFMAAHLAGVFKHPDMLSPDGVWYRPSESYRWYWAIWVGGAALGIVGATMLWSARWVGAFTAPITSLLIGGIVTADLWMMTLTYYPASTPDKYYPTTSFISQVQSLVPATERVIIEGQVMPANTGLVYNIRDWRYQDPMISKRAFAASKLLAPGYEKDGWAYYNMFFPTVKMEVAPAFGIRYVIYPSATKPANWEPFPDRPDFKRLAFKDGLGLYEIQDVPGFAYLSDHVEAVPGEPEAARWLEEMTWAKIRSYPAVVEAPASAISGIASAASGSSPGNANVTDYTSGHIVIQTDAQRSALLVVSESYYPGWHATLDGHPVEILRTNYVSQGVVVPAGQHRIELKYEPDSFRNGVLLSLAGLVGLGGLFVWSRRKPRQQAVDEY